MIPVYLDDSERETLDLLADYLGMSRSAAVRQALRIAESMMSGRSAKVPVP